MEKRLIMKSLLIDTSNVAYFIALVEEDAIIEAFPLPLEKQGKTLIATIDALCTRHSLSLKELSFIGTGLGPGPYTGIRIGISAAKAIAFALKIPLIGFPSLLALISDVEGRFCVAIDAKMGEYYALVGEKKEGKIISYKEGRTLLRKDLQEECKQVDWVLTLVDLELSVQKREPSLSLQPLLPFLYEQYHSQEKRIAPSPIYFRDP